MRYPRLPLLLLAALAVAVLALSGCGGGGGDATTDATEATAEETKPALTKAELIKQGDAVCAEVNTAVGSVGTSAAEPSSQASQVANLYTGMVTSLEGLGNPKEGASEYMNVIAAAEQLAKAEGEMKLASEREDSAALGEAETAASSALEEFQSQAGIFGFEQCSAGPSAPPTAPSTGSEGGESEEGGIEVEEGAGEYVPPEEEAGIEEVAPEGGGAGVEEVAPEGGGEESSSGGVGPG